MRPRDLRTARLDLLPTTAEHATALFAIYGDPEAVRHYPKTPCRDVAECAGLVQRMIDGERDGIGMRWSIVRRADGTVIGSLGFHAWDHERRQAYLSYELIPDARGQGYATEAARATLSFAARRMGLSEVLADVHVDNQPSRRVLDRLSFEPCARFARSWQDTVMYFLRYRLVLEHAAPGHPGRR